eukprot:scaffold83880_cov14-Prasinocladus_malaysianus.AAC.1
MLLMMCQAQVLTVNNQTRLQIVVPVVLQIAILYSYLAYTITYRTTDVLRPCGRPCAPRRPPHSHH